MAVLDEAGRRRAYRRSMATMANHRSPASEGVQVTKVELRQAVDGIDDILDAVFVQINQAIPAEVRSKLTLLHKQRIFRALVEERFSDGN